MLKLFYKLNLKNKTGLFDCPTKCALAESFKFKKSIFKFQPKQWRRSAVDIVSETETEDPGSNPARYKVFRENGNAVAYY
jgi:hypothetical protein